jgi:succinate dehydrogenase / fumarate reductase membrane anchor subunit
MSLRSPLGRVLGLGSAKDGTDHWWAQRVTAVALVVLGGWFGYSLVRIDSMTYLDVIRFVGQPFNAVLLTLLTLTLAYHSYLGVQVVIEDYVHAPGSKVVSMLLSRFAHVIVAVAAIYAILIIGIGR